MCLLTILCIYAKYHALSTIGPFTDHAFYTQWVKRLTYAPHFLPVLTESNSFLTSLIRDETSVLNIFLRQIYTCHQLIFTSFATIWLVIWSELIGASMQNQILISIINSCLFIMVLSQFPLIMFNRTSKKHLFTEVVLFGILIFLFANLSTFLTMFSALGRHNVGVLFLMISMCITLAWLKDGAFKNSKKYTLLMCLSQIFAIYSNYTNVFILPTATALAIITQPNIANTYRVRNTVIFCSTTMIIFSPVFIILAIIYFSGVNIPIGASLIDIGREALMDLGKGADIDTIDTDWTYLARINYWITFHMENFSTIGLGAGLAGLIHLAFWRHISLPLFIIVFHFITGSIMTGFYLHKTAAYSLPLICLGFAWLVTWSYSELADYVQKKQYSKYYLAALSIVFLVLPISHFVSDSSRLRDLENQTWGHVYKIKTDWDPVILSLQKHKLQKNEFIAWDYPITNTVISLMGTEKNIVFAQRPLSSLKLEYDHNRLRSYIKTRNLFWAKRLHTYLLIPAEIDISSIRQIFREILGPDGFDENFIPKFKEIDNWPRNSARQSLKLYQITRSF